MSSQVEPGLYRHWKGNFYRVLFLAQFRRYNSDPEIVPNAEVGIYGGDENDNSVRAFAYPLSGTFDVSPLLTAKSSTDGPTPDGAVLVIYVSLYGDGRVSVRTLDEFAGLAPSGEPRFAQPVRLPPVGEKVVVKRLSVLLGIDPDEHRIVREGDVVGLVRTRDLRLVVQVNGQPEVKTCMACSFCGMGPGDDYPVCGHPDAGSMGLYIKKEPLAHCPNFSKFQQHPSRNPDGSLKSG